MTDIVERLTVLAPQMHPRIAVDVREAIDEIERLRRWKNEAIEVLAAWDEVAALIPMTLGESKAAAVLSWAAMFAAGEAPGRWER